VGGEVLVRGPGELPSLQEYVLISQEQPLVEHFIRQPDDTWVLERTKNLDASLDLTSASISLMLSEIYRGVEFGPEDDQPSAVPPA
jgi:Uma2 family endonuclease